MEGQCSKTGGSGTPSPLLQANTSSQLTADLSSYEEACKRDPELQSFDATLHERTNHVICSLAAGVELRSLGSFKEVTNCLLEMNQDVVKVILESEEDIWDNPELFGLVKEYFKSSVETMEFYTALRRSLERAKNSQSIIQLAIKQDEEEVEMKDGAVDKKFEKTLEGLQKFTAAGNPFTPQFFALFKSVHEQQVSMLKKLVSRTKKLDEKLKSMETWRRVSNVLFVSAFVSVLIFSVVAAAVALQFFANIFSSNAPNTYTPNGGTKHLLDLLRNRLVKSSGNDHEDVQTGWEPIPFATDLVDAGINLKVSDGEHGSILDIEFKNGSLEMPSLLIQETTEVIIRNLISYEQCSPQCTDIITSYAVLLDSLINTTKDMDILTSSGIINNWLNPEEATQFFNKLYHDAYLKKYYYKKLHQEVNEYYWRRYPRWRALLMRNYFGTPWAIVSMFAAATLLILTIVQTIFTIIK